MDKEAIAFSGSPRARRTRPLLLVSAAVTAVLLSVPAIEQASAAFLPGGFPPRFGMAGLAAKPQGLPHATTVGHSALGNDPGRISHGDKGYGKGGKGDSGNSGKGRVIVGTGGDHPISNPGQPGRPTWKHPPRWYPPTPIVPVNPSVAAVPAGPNVGNPPPPVGGQVAQAARRTGGVPPANERRYVPDEVVVEVAIATTAQQINALGQRHRLTLLQSAPFQLGGTTLQRWRITDRRPVATVVRALESDANVLSAQPNYLFSLVGTAQSTAAPGEGDPSQYILDKMHLRQAHELANGDRVLVAVIDSGIDTNHPDLAGDIADSFNAIGTGLKVHAHGTAIAGAIAAHGRLAGAAPAAHILAIRAFSGTDADSGTTFAVMTGLNWAASHGARIINMSFAGPQDPGIARGIAAAHARGIALVAAAGNKGAKSPPLYPAADPNVIAVTASDENDRMPAFANRGPYVAVAAPGVDLMLLAPNGTYQWSSGTSFSSAYVTGTAALILELRPDFGPDQLRQTLITTAQHIGSDAPDRQFGAGLVDAYQAVRSLAPAPVNAAGMTPLDR
jgi:hypothetical protein